jgi:hypothetical protein
MRHPHPLTRIAFAALAVVAFPLWLYGRARWSAEIDAARRLRAAPRRPMLVRDAAPYDTAEGSVPRGGLAA